MHNKFVIVDSDILITGSFNWTVQAAANNQVLLVVLSDSYFIEKYRTEFDRLWKEFSAGQYYVPPTKDQAATRIQKQYKKHYYKKY